MCALGMSKNRPELLLLAEVCVGVAGVDTTAIHAVKIAHMLRKFQRAGGRCSPQVHLNVIPMFKL